MNKQPLFIAFSNQKGGVGKSALTTLVAGYFHYAMDKNVVVVDCDYPQYSIYAMRDRDKQVVEKSDSLKEQMMNQFTRIEKKAYTILTSPPDEAKDIADAFLESSEVDYDVVFFDLPGTVNSMGIFQSIMNMDYIFTPIISDRMAMQSSLAFATTIQDFMKKQPSLPLKGLYLFWNMVDKRVNKDLYNIYNEIISRLQLNILDTVIPATHRYSKELSFNGKPFFRSTLFPPPNRYIKGSNIDLLTEEIIKIINQ
jgi:cellulose biosynthesis protein BcsQ